MRCTGHCCHRPHVSCTGTEEAVPFHRPAQCHKGRENMYSVIVLRVVVLAGHSMAMDGRTCGLGSEVGALTTKSVIMSTELLMAGHKAVLIET